MRLVSLTHKQNNDFRENTLEETQPYLSQQGYLSLLLQEQTLYVAEGLQSTNTPFKANATLLVATEWRVGVNFEMRVDPNRACIKLSSDPACLIQVVRPHTCAQSHLCVVRPCNNVLLVCPCQQRHNRTKRLLRDDPGVLVRSVNDGRCDEVAWLVLVLAANCDRPFFLLNVGEERLDLLKLHAVLDGAEEDALVVAVANFECLRKFDQGVSELAMDRFMNVDTFDGKADLAGIQEGKSADLQCLFSRVNLSGGGWMESTHLLSNSIDINVLANDGRVVAAPGVSVSHTR